MQESIALSRDGGAMRRVRLRQDNLRAEEGRSDGARGCPSSARVSNSRAVEGGVSKRRGLGNVRAQQGNYLVRAIFGSIAGSGNLSVTGHGLGSLAMS